MKQKLDKFLLVVLLALFLFATSTIQAFAADNFSTKYNVIYTVNENADTRAVFSITLTNTSDQFYASSYKMQLGFDTITNIVAYDDLGTIKPELSKTDEGQTVELQFNKRVVGDGKSLHFAIAFDTPDVAKQNGSVWEINIPGIQNKDDFTAFTAEVKVPQSFGQPTYIKPVQKNNSLVFSKEQLETSGISIAFGNSQAYTFHLTYHLKNTNVFPITTEIALPPDTNYQRVAIGTIHPEPLNVTVDGDGNWIASYKLLPSQKKDVVVTGAAQLLLHPESTPLSQKYQEKYTKELPFWQTKDPGIQSLAKSLKTPENIYQYVVDTLTYDFTRVSVNQKRFGATAILKEPSEAVCREFTDFFIAIARAARIPAREVNGFALTENSKQRPLSLLKDILHAWPEYYDTARERWIMVDPTWGNTTGGVDYFHVLDFDHFAFVIKGLDSEYPIPAGGYKYEGDENKKDVEVSLSKEFFVDTPQSEVSVLTKQHYLSSIPVSGSIVMKNVGRTLSPATTLFLTTQKLSPRIQQVSISAVPPYGTLTVPFTLHKTPFLTNTSDILTMKIADATFQRKITVSPFIITKEIIIGGTVFVIFTIGLFIIAIKTRRIPIFRQK